MPYTNGAINDLGTLAAYSEYTEETPQPSSYARPPFQKADTGKITVRNSLTDLPAPVSPYIRELFTSAVGWQAFPAAKLNADKPTLLTIGYSSHHWCHVMNRDCWLDAETAGMVNTTCNAVIADREEFPVLDAIMTIYCRLQNGTSGYPLNIFLDTVSMRPFFCTTWLPKRTIGQMPGLTELLPRIGWIWGVQHEDADRARNELSAKMAGHMERLAGSKHKSSARIGKLTAYQALDDMRRIFDVRWGGFGASQKFPEPDKLLFLLRHSAEYSGATKHDLSDARTMTDITLRRMWRGGIHDHLGGGFSVSSSDERWLVPHFEKLLCYNAMILFAASLSQRLDPNLFHRLLAEDVIFSLTKDFADNGAYSQGFRSSVDGDTADGEGRYYLWNENEIRRILPEGEAGLFCAAYAVLPSGNFGSELAGSQMSWNILYEASTVTELARRFGMKGSEVSAKLSSARKILLDYRDKRYPLRADNKILMGWNGLTIAALAHASVSFEVREWLDIAERTALFITKSFRDKSGGWCHYWADGKNSGTAVCDDVAYFLWGVVELFKASEHFGAGEKQLSDWREIMRSLADMMIEAFGDEKCGGLFMTREPVLGIRLKTCEDMNSLPSANSVAAIVLDEVAFMLEDKKYSDFSRGIIGCFSRYVRENPLSCLTMITADMMWKAFKPKPVVPAEAPQSQTPPTDEELNREEPEIQTDEKPSSRPARRNERPARRSSRTHRTREK